jgi:methionyl-tRNA formyltransferase
VRRWFARCCGALNAGYFGDSYSVGCFNPEVYREAVQDGAKYWRGERVKLVFCGTPDFAVPTLEAVLTAGHEVALVVTQPDRAAGRGMEMQAPPVKQTGLAHGIPVIQPEKIKNNLEFRERLEAIRPDAILVVAYGRIVPQWMLDLPRFGNINLHGSLLPKYRGAAPIQWAVANGELVTGVTTMLLEAGLDTGPMLLARAVPIGLEETAADVFETLAGTGSELMVETLAALEAGTITPQVQDHGCATLAPILTREDGWIDFARSAKQIYDRWRGFQPWPGAHTILRGKKLIAHRMRLVDAPAAAEAGVMLVDRDRLLVGCGERTLLELLEVQMEGKKRMGAAEFLRGYQVRTGERLGL